jgi:hypothetical protein
MSARDIDGLPSVGENASYRNKNVDLSEIPSIA